MRTFPPRSRIPITGGLVFAARPGYFFRALALFFVHVPRFAADESFVRLYLTGQQSEPTVFQREPKAMIHKPGRLLCHAEGAMPLRMN